MKSLVATVLLCTGLCMAGFGTSAAQPSASAAKPASSARKAAAGRSECVVAVGLCVTVPTPSLDSLVEIVLTPDGSFTSSETLQRTRLILNGSSAEVLRVLLHEEDAATTEAVALIEGDEGLVYSIALRCAPQDYTRLEPVFQRAIHSWRIQPPAMHSAAPSATPSQPKQDSDKK